jgi:hypothetical protein
MILSLIIKPSPLAVKSIGEGEELRSGALGLANAALIFAILAKLVLDWGVLWEEATKTTNLTLLAPTSARRVTRCSPSPPLLLPSRATRTGTGVIVIIIIICFNEDFEPIPAVHSIPLPRYLFALVNGFPHVRAKPRVIVHEIVKVEHRLRAHK